MHDSMKKTKKQRRERRRKVKVNVEKVRVWVCLRSLLLFLLLRSLLCFFFIESCTISMDPQLARRIDLCVRPLTREVTQDRTRRVSRRQLGVSEHLIGRLGLISMLFLS